MWRSRLQQRAQVAKMVNMSAAAPVRRPDRTPVTSIAMHVRPLGASAWSAAHLHDLSLGGAQLRTSTAALGMSDLLEARLTADDEVVAQVTAQVVRLLERDGAQWLAVRFNAVGPDAAAGIARLLGHIGVADDEPTTTTGGVDELRLHDVSIYELLELDPAAGNAELEAACEALIQRVAAEAHVATGRKEARLQIVLSSLQRLRPLWSDPIKRARYDLRWGYLRIPDRLHAADEGTGPSLWTLSGIWFDLFPDRVRSASAVLRGVRDREPLIAALVKALELDPFCPRKRAHLTNLNRGATELAVADDAPFVRGTLREMPLLRLLYSVALEDGDIDVVVKQGKKAVGVVGILRGELVTSIAGRNRGLPALVQLCGLTEGRWQARNAAPREHLRHMTGVSAADVLEDLQRRRTSL
jgi:hypothetical protein